MNIILLGSVTLSNLFVKRGVAMPQLLENKLAFQAKKRFPGDKERQDKFIADTLKKRNWGEGKEKPK